MKMLIYLGNNDNVHGDDADGRDDLDEDTLDDDKDEPDGGGLVHNVTLLCVGEAVHGVKTVVVITLLEMKIVKNEDI